MANMLDVIEYDKEMQYEPIHRIPEWGFAEMQMGAKLIVHERQVAVFYQNGKVLDVFESGQHKITKSNVPKLVAHLGKQFNKNASFPIEVYFVSTYNFTDRKWGTPLSILVADLKDSVPLVRSLGTYAYTISNPKKFVEEVCKQPSSLNSAVSLESMLRNKLLSILTIVIGEISKKCKSGKEVINSAQLITDTVFVNTTPEFLKLGITLSGFDIVSIIPSPKMAEELQNLGVKESTSSSEIIAGSQPTSVNVKLGDNAIIFGSITVAQTIKDSIIQADKANITAELKELLIALSVEVGKLSTSLTKEEGTRVGRALSTVVEEASSAKPNREWWQVSIDGLTKAAKNLGEIGKPVLEIISKLVPILLSISR
jgi:hypothetical protein